MTTRAEKERQKQVQEKCQAILNQLLRDEDNKYCVDCDAKGPRWAAWNLGIFLCIRCAGIHRNLGVHISKVKSVNLDTWTPEQVASLQQMGNSRARAVYEANLPDSFRRPQTDSSLEAFVRAKYEQKKYIAKEWVPPPAPKPATPNAIPAPRSRLSSSSSSTVAANTSPTSSSIKPNVKPLPVKSNAAVDLLGLDDVSGSNVSSPNGSVGFGNFLSSVDSAAVSSSASSPVVEGAGSATGASAALQPDASSTSASTNEEENFFSQVDDPGKKQQLMKESILSLYGQSTSSQPSMFGVPGGMYVNSQVYAPQQPVGMGYPNVGMATQPMGFVANGLMGNPSHMNVGQMGNPSSNVQVNVGLMGIPSSNVQAMPVSSQPVGGLGGNVGANLVGGNNPFLNNPAANAGMAGFYSANTVNATNVMGQNPAAFGQHDLFSIAPSSSASNGDLMAWEQNPFVSAPSSSSSTSTTNMFFYNPSEQTQLQQQMSAMTLGGAQMGHPTGIASAGASGRIPWTNQPAGHTLSTNLWQ